MNVIGQIDPSAFAAAQRMHHREDEPTLEFPSSVSPRARGLLALKAINWRANGGGGMLPEFFPIKLYSFRNIFQNALFSAPDVDLTGILELSPTCRVDPFSQMTFGAQVTNFTWDGLTSDRVTGCDGAFWSIGATSIKMRNWSFPASTNISNMFSSAASLVSLDCGGSVFGETASTSGMFSGCRSLTDYIPHDSGFAHDINLKDSPLSAESATRVMGALRTVSTATTCTLRSAMKSAYEASPAFVSARDAAISRGWTVAWA